VIIGVGFPKQEWLGLAIRASLKEQLMPSPLFLCLGASAEFYVGTIKRSPFTKSWVRMAIPALVRTEKDVEKISPWCCVSVEIVWQRIEKRMVPEKNFNVMANRSLRLANSQLFNTRFFN
jgi:hypothetical protein